MKAAVLLLALLAPLSHAHIYKWADANGKTHYADRKDDAATDQGCAQRRGGPPQRQGDQQKRPRYRAIDVRAACR